MTCVCLTNFGAFFLIAVLAVSLASGQTVNIGSASSSIGGSYSNPIVSTIPINSTDLIVVVSGSFTAGTNDFRWFWYRSGANSDFKTLNSTLVSNLTVSYDAQLGDVTVIRTTKNPNYAILVYISDAIYGQEIDLLNPTNNNGKFLISPHKDYDRSLTAVWHANPTNSNTFSAIFGAQNSTHTCIFKSAFSDSLGSYPVTLFCPGTNSLMNTYSQAWGDPIDGKVFYVTSAYPNNTYFSHKCVIGSSYNQISCTPITQIKLSQAILQSYGMLVPNSNLFFYVGTSDNSPIQVIVVDFVANTSSTATVPLPITGTRTISLVESVVPAAVSLIAYDPSIPGFQVLDIIWNSSTKNITYYPVANFTSANLYTISGINIPAASLGPSIFAIATASTDSASQMSARFFGRQYCGDGLVLLNEDCDSVQYCNATCQCTNGVAGLNSCMPPITSPVPVPVAPPNDASSAPIPISTNPTAQRDNGTTIIGPIGPLTDQARVKIEVIVPAVVVPVVVVVAGIIVLVVLLKRRNNKKKTVSEMVSVSSDDGNLSPRSETARLEPVQYFGVPTIQSPELGKDSNTSAGTNTTARSNTSDGSARTVHSPLDGFDVTLQTIATSSKRQVDTEWTDDRMHIPYSELKFIREIGAGAYGKVFIGEWQKTSVALKISAVTSSDEFVREAELIINLRPHPNVVQVLGMSSDGVNVVMIMEFCDGGSLDSLVFDKDVPMNEKIHLLSGIAKGIYHLHKNKIVHRDLAARNILLSRGEPKISDFGMSRKLQEATAHGQTKATVGPIRWMAPECLRSTKYSTKSDVWSFGILCWEVLSGEEPHLNTDPLTIGVAIRDQGVTPSINSEWDPALQSLMTDCWKLDPEQRPEFDEICERLSKLDE